MSPFEPRPATVLWVSFLLAAVSAPMLSRGLTGRGWRDRPRRDRHALRDVSRAGGAGWLLAFCGSLLFAAVAVTAASRATAAGPPGRSVARLPLSWWIAAGLAVLGFLLGRWDDAGRLRSRAKWVLQSALLAAGIVLWQTVGRDLPDTSAAAGSMGEGPAGLIGLLGAALLALSLQTALQIFDNLDAALGLVAGGTCIVLGLDPAARTLAVPALAAGGAAVGVLLWNLPPARLYFGNCGSLPVATLLAFWAFATVSPAGSGTGGPPRLAERFLSLLPLVWPLADLVFVVVGRMRRGIAPWTGGRDHTTHRLARALRSDRSAALVLLIYTATTVILALAGQAGSR